MAAKPAKAAPAKKEAAAPEAGAEAPKSNKKMIMIFGGVILLLVLVIAGGAAWYFLKAKDAGAAHVEEKKVEVHKEPKFITLEHFVGNLQADSTGAVNFAVEMSLEVFDPEVEVKIKGVMPEIRSKLNLLISSKTASELSTANGKKRLAQQIKKEINGLLGIHAEGEAQHGEEHVEEGAPAAESAPASAEAGHEAAVAHEAAPVHEAASSGVAAVDNTPVVEEPVSPDAKGVAAVLFTSFILAY